eukprot:3321973-Amphidinium_carterae.1
MSLEEYRQSVHQLNGVNTVLTRSQAPKRGRIGDGQSQPLASLSIQDAALVEDEQHTRKTTRLFE